MAYAQIGVYDSLLKAHGPCSPLLEEDSSLCGAVLGHLNSAEGSVMNLTIRRSVVEPSPKTLNPKKIIQRTIICH